MNEIGITQIDPVDGRIYKGMTNCGRPGFSLDVVYTLADGRKQRSTVSSERKKNVLAALERERRAAAAGSMTANFNDKGEFWGTTQKWTIGSAGLVPQGEGLRQ
ncbi:MAG TPA: hypothetical protein VNU68_21295 [Verrucomicrobiae bacterium]|nr:hypothetical protein [Verrucomicrobiae bacterium]